MPNDNVSVYASASRAINDIVRNFVWVQNSPTQWAQRADRNPGVKASVNVPHKKSAEIVEFPEGYCLARAPRGSIMKHDKTCARDYLDALSDVRIGNGSESDLAKELAANAVWSGWKLMTGRATSLEGAMMAQILDMLRDKGITVEKIELHNESEDAFESGTIYDKVDKLIEWLNLNTEAGYIEPQRANTRQASSSFTL